MHPMLNTSSYLTKFLCCPTCKSGLEASSDMSLCCTKCGVSFPLTEGIVDFIPTYKGSRKFLQWAMERQFIVEVYEDFFRPAFTRFFSRSGVSYDKETAWLDSLLPKDIRYVLDLASGTGRYTEIANTIRSPELVFAIDMSLPMLLTAKRCNDERGVSNVIYLRADAHKLPFKRNTFDTILCFGAMHLFQYPALAINEFSRVLDSKGTFAALTAGSIQGNEKRMQVLSKLLSWTFFERKWLSDHFAKVDLEMMSYTQSSYVAMFSAQKR